jgi:hypothetical protein
LYQCLKSYGKTCWNHQMAVDGKISQSAYWTRQVTSLPLSSTLTPTTHR